MDNHIVSLCKLDIDLIREINNINASKIKGSKQIKCAKE